MLQNELESEVVSKVTQRFNSLVYRRKQNERLTLRLNAEDLNAATAVFRLNIMSFSPQKRSYKRQNGGKMHIPERGPV